jgi:hypothetical protein
MAVVFLLSKRGFCMANDVSVHLTVVPGSVVAVILSWALNHSVGWAIIHFLLGWFYVGYACIARGSEIIPAMKALFG